MSEPESSIRLKAENLHKRYRVGASWLPVLEGCDLELHGGQVCALMGSSGSGKSTLLNLLGLLDKPDQGRLLLAGCEVQHLGQRARARLRAEGIGFVFQQFHLLPELNAFENVLMPRRLGGQEPWRRRRRAERERARAMLDRVGLDKRRRHRPSQLSGGEQQRVAIARALVSEPAVLLADEPTGNLDRQTGIEVLELLLRLAREREAAVLLATHDSEVASQCDRIVRLADGRLFDQALPSAPEVSAAEATDAEPFDPEPSGREDEAC